MERTHKIAFFKFNQQTSLKSMTTLESENNVSLPDIVKYTSHYQ
jgi:hypothetical protein